MADRRTFLSISAAAAVAAPVLGGSASAAAPATSSGPGEPALPQAPDRELRALLREIDARRTEATVRKLASFGTRHTLSSQDDPVRGIGAARDWIFEQLTGYAAVSGGRMTVEKQSFIQPVSSRIPVPTPITNIIATLRGDVTPERIYVVTGHYDSRVTRVNGAVLWSLAQAPSTPKGVLIDTTALTNLSTLRWTPGTEADLAGYEVVWRESTAPDWTHVIPVGNVSTATIDLSKDNVQFGVRAVDAAGHRSPAAAPQPSA